MLLSFILARRLLLGLSESHNSKGRELYHDDDDYGNAAFG